MNGPNAVIAQIMVTLGEKARRNPQAIPHAIAVFAADEEIGSPRYGVLAENLKHRNFNPDIMVCFDGAPENKIEVAEKGLHTVRATINLSEGQEHSAHAP